MHPSAPLHRSVAFKATLIGTVLVALVMAEQGYRSLHPPSLDDSLA